MRRAIFGRFVELGYREKGLSIKVRESDGADIHTAHGVAARGIVGEISIRAWWRSGLRECGLGIGGGERITYQGIVV